MYPLPSQPSTLGNRTWMRRKHPCLKRANKVGVTTSSKRCSWENTKFLHCPFLSPFLSTATFSIARFHKTFSLYSHFCRSEPERKQYQTQREKQGPRTITKSNHWTDTEPHLSIASTSLLNPSRDRDSTTALSRLAQAPSPNGEDIILKSHFTSPGSDLEGRIARWYSQ